MSDIDGHPRRDRLAWHRVSEDWIEVTGQASTVTITNDGGSTLVAMSLDADTARVVRDALTAWLETQ